MDLSTSDETTLEQPATGVRPGEAVREAVTSFAQRRIWLLERITPGTPAYSICFGQRLIGPLDVDALRRAVTAISNRHDVLRTSFRLSADDVLQRVGPRRPVPLPMDDLSALPSSSRAERVETALRRTRNAVLDLSAGDVLRTHLLRLASDEHILLLTVHHIVFDAWSNGIFQQELAAHYDALRLGRAARLPPLPLQYADFAIRQRREVTGTRMAEQLAYWKQQLRDLPDTEVPGRRGRPAEPNWRGNRLDVHVPPDLARAVSERGRAARASSFMTYLSAFQVLLRRYTGADDLSVASPVAGRATADVEGLIGLFINTLVLRVDLSGNPRFVDVLARTRDAALDAYAHQDVSFEQVVDALRPPRTERNPFTQVLFGVQNAPMTPFRLTGLETEGVNLGTGATKLDLHLMVGGRPDNTRLSWIYRAELYDAGDIERMSHHFLTMLAAVSVDPHARIDELPLLPAAERVAVLESGRGADPSIGPNLTARGFSRGETLHGRFSRQVRATPDAVAVVADDATLTYQELDAAAARLASRLVQAGAAPGDRVAIALDRSAAMAVAVLATLKASATYVPVDPALPPLRAASISADASPAVLLVPPGLAAPSPGPTVLTVDLPELVADHPEGLTLPERAVGTDLAYVLYTSGSTGQPKGVAVAHRQVLSYLDAIDELVGLTPGRYAMVQPLAVDASVTMLYGAWHRGGTLYAVGRRTALDGQAMARLIQDERIDYLKVAPSHLEALQRVTDPATLIPARWLMIGGEASSERWARDLAGFRPGCRVYNHYGPTETTVGVLAHRVDTTGETGATRTTPLGRPLAGTRIYLLDTAGELVPPMVAGELWVGGWLVADGYLGRPAQTAERFVADPFTDQPGARMYRTGDFGRRRPDGTIEFLGRDDDQVKIRGNRVELGEIAAALREHAAIREAAARVQMVNGAATVTAYVTPTAGSGGLDPDELTGFLRQRLPAHMLPAAIVTLDALPLTRHGKLDARALPPPRPNRRDRSEPVSQAERHVGAIWCHVLNLDRVGRHDDFFQLGGHSLLATRLAAELATAFRVELPVGYLFRFSTVATQARFLEQAGATASDTGPSAGLVRFGRAGAPTLFCVHPISGSVGCYTALARHLPEHCLIGVEAPGIRSDLALPTAIPELAGHYLTTIRRAYPGGRYLFAGWSMGGLLAYEMAQQLAADGAEAEPVVLLDTVLPRNRSDNPSDAELAAAFARDIAATLGVPRGEPTVNELAMMDSSEQVRRLQRWLEGRDLLADQVPVEELARRLEVFRTNYVAQERYRPSRSSVPVILVRPVHHSIRSEGWKQLAGDLLTVKEFPADHYSLLREPTVAEVAGWLDKHLGVGLPGR